MLRAFERAAAFAKVSCTSGDKACKGARAEKKRGDRGGLRRLRKRWAATRLRALESSASAASFAFAFLASLHGVQLSSVLSVICKALGFRGGSLALQGLRSAAASPAPS